jgi:hypothetical protein
MFESANSDYSTSRTEIHLTSSYDLTGRELSAKGLPTSAVEVTYRPNKIGTPRRQPKRRGKSQQGTISPEQRCQLRSLWVKAKRQAQLITIAIGDSPMESFAPACELSTILDQMWNLRAASGDENWIGILDALQTVLAKLGGEGIAELRLEQAQQLECFIQDLLSLSSKSVDDLIEATRLMKEFGIPPFVDFQKAFETGP